MARIGWHSIRAVLLIAIGMAGLAARRHARGTYAGTRQPDDVSARCHWRNGLDAFAPQLSQ